MPLYGTTCNQLKSIVSNSHKNYARAREKKNKSKKSKSLEGRTAAILKTLVDEEGKSKPANWKISRNRYFALSERATQLAALEASKSPQDKRDNRRRSRRQK